VAVDGVTTQDDVARYASWPRRVGAAVIDALPVVAAALVALALMWLTRNRACDGDPAVRDIGAQCATNVTTIGQLFFLLCWLATIGYAVWNLGRRQGTTGSSLGKSVLKIRVVGVRTGEPIGFWRSLVRQLAHVLDLFTLGLGYLWPLWDRRNQTFADKLSSTVCVSETR
jgi:uncharacterized RDD family membrane protein YckC